VSLFSVRRSPGLSPVANLRVDPGATHQRKLSGIADNAGELIAQVRGDLKKISGRTNVLLANLNDVTGSSNRQQLAGILSRTNSLIAAQSPRIDRIIAQIEALSHDADDDVKKAGPLLEHADGTVTNVNATVDQMRDPLKHGLVALESTMDQAKNLMVACRCLCAATMTTFEMRWRTLGSPRRTSIS